jgi:hypothetical protein
MSLYDPSVNIHTTEAENRYFQFFSDHTAHELSGFFDATLWTRLVLQESHNVAAIRHAVIALGALNKSLESAPGPDLKVNDIQSIDKKHHEQAVLQHLKAIQALNYYISSSNAPQLRNALIACLLFVCFETFQGSYASSVQQTYEGLKILRSYYVGKPGSRPWIPRRSLPTSSKSMQKTMKVSKALKTRMGCDNVLKEVAMALHLEEYLETDNTGPESEDPAKPADINPTIDPGSEIYEIEPPVYDPRAEHVDIRQMAGTDFNKEQQRSINMYPLRPIFKDNPFSTEVSAQPSSSSDTTRKTSTISVLSSSTVLPLVSYTPPSTEPHTPSPSNPTFAHNTSGSSLKRPLASRSPTPIPILQNDLTIEEILIQTFVRLDGQGLFFGMIPGIPPLYWDIHKVWHVPIPPSFPDFHTAQRCWDFLQDHVLQFYRRTSFDRTYAPASSDSPASIAKQHATYLKQLSTFATSFQPYLDNAITPDGAITNPAALVLSLYQKCVSIVLATVPHDSEMFYDAFLPDFQYITRTCALLIAAQDVTCLPRNTRFSFDIGIVPPLHVTATKCRDPVVRREAIDLLFASPRQEGMWDGVLSARIGRWIVSCDEEGLPPPDLPKDRGGWFSSMGGEKQQSYPSPPRIIDEPINKTRGGWENGKWISEVVSGVVGRGANQFGSKSLGGDLENSIGMRASIEGVPRPKKLERKAEEGGVEWRVPEENRVQLIVVDFHIPDRYIKVKCQRALLSRDGSREERETVIAW